MSEDPLGILSIEQLERMQRLSQLSIGAGNCTCPQSKSHGRRFDRFATSEESHEGTGGDPKAASISRRTNAVQHTPLVARKETARPDTQLKSSTANSTVETHDV